MASAVPTRLVAAAALAACGGDAFVGAGGGDVVRLLGAAATVALVAALHYGGVYFLIEVLKHPRSLYPNVRYAAGAVLVLFTYLAWAMWWLLAIRARTNPKDVAATRRRRTAAIYTMSSTVLYVMFAVKMLLPAYGDLTNENLLFFGTIVWIPMFYVVFYVASWVSPVVTRYYTD